MDLLGTMPVCANGKMKKANEQRQKPPTNSLSKLVNSNLPAEARTAVEEACGSHRASIWYNSPSLKLCRSAHVIFLNILNLLANNKCLYTLRRFV